MIPKDNLHDEIMTAFNQYFIAHRNWVTTERETSCIRLRAALLELRHLCKSQRAIIQDWRFENFTQRRPSRRAISIVNNLNKPQE